MSSRVTAAAAATPVLLAATLPLSDDPWIALAEGELVMVRDGRPPLRRRERGAAER